jgi:hypothetical protein
LGFSRFSLPWVRWTLPGCRHGPWRCSKIGKTIGSTAAKETAMIQLTEEQSEALTRAEQPLLVVDPRTQEEFVLVRKDRFEAMQKWVASLKRRWDDPADDDLIRKP